MYTYLGGTKVWIDTPEQMTRESADGLSVLKGKNDSEVKIYLL